MRKISILFSLCLVMLLFVGCGEVRLDSYTIIDNKGEATLNLKFSYDSVVKGVAGSDILSRLSNNTLKVNSYYDQEKRLYIEETVLSQEDISKVFQQEEIAKFINIKIDKKSGVIYNTQNVTISFNGALSDVIGEDKSAFLSEVPFVNVINVNGKIIESNAQSQINDETVQWSLVLSQISNNTKFYLKYKNLNYVSFFIGGLLLVVILYVIFRAVIKKYKVN